MRRSNTTSSLNQRSGLWIGLATQVVAFSWFLSNLNASVVHLREEVAELKTDVKVAGGAAYSRSEAARDLATRDGAMDRYEQRLSRLEEQFFPRPGAGNQ